MKKLLLLSTIVLFMFSCSEEPTIVTYPNGTGTGTGTNTGGNNSNNEKPIASFNYEKGDSPFQIIFTNTSKYAQRFSWNFGDGKTSTEKNPKHRYSEAGTYTVTLTAYNGTLSDRIDRRITITKPTKCYCLGVRYERVGYLNKYYKSKLVDDGPWVKKTWFSTYYTLVDKTPTEYMFTNPVLLENVPKHDYYTIYVYWSDNTSKDGTQILRQKIYTDLEMGDYPAKVTEISDNGDTKITVFFKWE